MRPLEEIHLAIGKIAYVIAVADGEIQKKERQKFHDIVAEELEAEHPEFDLSAMMFQMLDKKCDCRELTYREAIDSLRVNRKYLSPALKGATKNILRGIAEAFPPVTETESIQILQVMEDLESLEAEQKID